jgi:hypothetical protein
MQRDIDNLECKRFSLEEEIRNLTIAQNTIKEVQEKTPKTG